MTRFPPALRRLALTVAARLCALALLTVAGLCSARVEVIPPYGITPDINNLNIAYFVKQDSIKIMLYVINHEKFDVICDSEYQAGPDRKHELEQKMAPEKAVSFGYDYSREPHHIQLMLKCIRADAAPTVQEPPKPGIRYYEDSPPADSTTR